jgi:HlyD family secretion protein
MLNASNNRKRLFLIMAVVLSLILVSIVALHSYFKIDGIDDLLAVLHQSSKATTNKKTLTVTPQPVLQSTTISGHLGPGDVSNILAPFSATVKSTYFTYNKSVVKDVKLLELDVSDIETQLWDAKSTYLEAESDYDRVINWKDSSEVHRAHRQQDAVEERLTDAKHKAEQAKMLYKNDIISKNEYQSTISSLHAVERSLQDVKSELISVLAKGDQKTIERAKLTLQSARVKRDELEKKVAGAVVRSPAMGVAVLPIGDGTSTANDGSAAQPVRLQVGVGVTGGSAILGIADLSRFSVSGMVDEIEVNKIRSGQDVKVTSPAFPGITLNGNVSYVSKEAAVTQGAGNLAKFAIRVTIPAVKDRQRQQIRIGMTANMTIVTYNNPAAIVLPPAAIHGEPGNYWVLVRKDNHASTEQVAVKTGITTLGGVEIISGLQGGNQIIVK